MGQRRNPAMERARQRVKEVRDFYYHLMTFVLVNGLIIYLDRRTGPNDQFLGLDWAFWVIFAWGFGIAGHAIATFLGDYRVNEVSRQDSRERVDR